MERLASEYVHSFRRCVMISYTELPALRVAILDAHQHPDSRRAHSFAPSGPHTHSASEGYTEWLRLGKWRSDLRQVFSLISKFLLLQQRSRLRSFYDVLLVLWLSRSYRQTEPSTQSAAAAYATRLCSYSNDSPLLTSLQAHPWTLGSSIPRPFRRRASRMLYFLFFSRWRTRCEA